MIKVAASYKPKQIRPVGSGPGRTGELSGDHARGCFGTLIPMCQHHLHLDQEAVCDWGADKFKLVCVFKSICGSGKKKIASVGV